MKTVATLLGMVLMAGHAFGQGQSLDQLIKNGVVVPSDKGQSQPQQPAPPPAPPPAAAPRPPQAKAPAPAPAAGGNSGFHMNLLPGWRAQLSQNGAVVARSGDGLSTVLVAPVLDAGDAAPLDWMRRRGAAFLGGYLKSPAIAAVYPSQNSRSAALASVDYAGANGPGTAHVMCFFAGGVGTMFVIAGPRSAFPNQSGPMVRMLASFSFNGEKAAGSEGRPGAQPGADAAPAAPSVQYTKFADRNEGAFTLDVPAGWKVEGGLKRHSTLDVRPAVYATSPDGGTVIRLGDWDLGTFTEPNQALAMAGMREGGTYSPGYGNVWQIRRYMPGPQFAQEYVAKLARDTQTGSAQIKTVKPLPEYSKQQNLGGAIIRTVAGEADFNCIRNSRESAGVVVVATTATSMAGGAPGAIWYVSFLEALVAPADQVPAAQQIARHMTETFQMDAQWQAQQSQTTMRTSEIVRQTGEAINKIIIDTDRNRQRAVDQAHRNFDDYIRGVVRLRNPDSGEELEGEAGKNYYYKVPNRDRPVGTNRPIVGDPNVTELEQIH